MLVLVLVLVRVPVLVWVKALVLVMMGALGLRSRAGGRWSPENWGGGGGVGKGAQLTGPPIGYYELWR